MALLQLSFRGSEGYASPPGDYGIAEYPHTYGVFVSGFTPVGGFIWRDRSTSVDARLAGILGIGNGPSYGDLIVDFPSAGGNIVIRAAWGDATNEQTHYVEYKDGATTFATINGVTTASGNFLDATNVNRAAADWPSLNATLSRTMVGSKLIIRMGGQGGSNSTSIAHLEVDWTAGVSAPVFAGTIPTLTGTQGVALAAQSPTIASYFSGTGITYTVSTALPAGLSINSGTGVISGTPSTDTDWSGTVTATNGGGAISSNTFAITISAASAAPSITVQPSNQTATAGGTATFSVTATGSGTLTYQWRKNGSNISGATSSSYTTPTLVIGDNGALFSVVVHGDTAPDATSNNATLTVNPAAATALNLTIAAAAGLTGIKGVVLSAAAPGAAVTVIKSFSAAAFDGAGAMSIDITGLGVLQGQYRWVEVTQSTGDPAQSPAPFGAHGPVLAS